MDGGGAVSEVGRVVDVADILGVAVVFQDRFGYGKWNRECRSSELMMWMLGVGSGRDIYC